MIGGVNSYAAGDYTGNAPLKTALPVKMDIKDKKALSRQLPSRW